MGQRGFLILEVMIAGLILTASIAASMYLFRVGFDGLQRANEANVISSKVPQAVNLIRTLDLGPGKGEEALGDDVRLRWESETAGRNIPRIDTSEGRDKPTNYEVYLFRVKFSLHYKNLDRQYRMNVFRYRTLLPPNELF